MKPKLDNLPGWAKFIAQQPEGDWYAFSHKPTVSTKGFTYGSKWAEEGKFSIFIAFGKPNEEWEKTIEEI